jgi:undecaprenyl-diphosphatase
MWKSKALAKDGKSIFVGMVNGYAGKKWGVLPKLSADIDSERELLYHELNVSGMIQTLQKEQLVKPQIGTNFTGDQFFTDGKTYIVSIL